MIPTHISIHIAWSWRVWRMIRVVNEDTGATAYATPFVPGSVERALDRVTS